MMSIVLIICITVLIAGLLFMLQSGIQLELIVFVGVVTIETIALILTLARRKASPDTDQATVPVSDDATLAQSAQKSRTTDISEGLIHENPNDTEPVEHDTEEAGAPSDSTLLPATDETASSEEMYPEEDSQAPAQSNPLAHPSALVDSLTQAVNPLATLAELVEDTFDQVRKVPEPTYGAAETFARWLSEAGLGEDSDSEEAEMPRTRLVRLYRNSLAYIRIEQPETTYVARRKVLAVEAVLNRMLIVESLAGEGLSEDGEGELYRLAQSAQDSICAQAAQFEWAIGRRGGKDGEWAARSIIATQFESWTLPYRLEATFRCSTLNSEAAVEIRLPDPEVFPRSRWSRELDRVIPTTGFMRKRTASAYALRLGILVAAGMFEASGHLRHVHVAGVFDTARRHCCLFSVRFDADRFRMLVDLEAVSDPASIYRSCNARLHLTHGVLDPVDQHFSLDEERFCPRRRYATPELSKRVLPTAEGKMLGATRVADLGCDGEAKLRSLGDKLSRSLTDSCENNVRALLNLAYRENDAAVTEAAQRTSERLITGEVGLTPDEVVDDFVTGDNLTRSVNKALVDITHGRTQEAINNLADVLAPLEIEGAYEDQANITWRSFRSYAERALYNRLEAVEGEFCNIVPTAYYDAHLLLASALLERGHTDAALGEARLVSHLDPLDERARLRAVRALEVKGDIDGAMRELEELLELAYTPEGVAVGYYRLAFMCWQSGDIEGADACYRRALRFPSELSLAAATELTALNATNPSLLVNGAPDDEEVNQRLVERGIPLAPITPVTDALMECTAAAIDVEVFPVARSLARALARLSGDDAAFTIADSLENEPDD